VKQGMMEETQETSNRADFSFILIFFWIFPKGTSRNQDFLFVHYFFYIFLRTRFAQDVTTKIGNCN